MLALEVVCQSKRGVLAFEWLLACILVSQGQLNTVQ